MDKTFLSQTTPGLNIDFKNYIIEIVCLNVKPKLNPRFWNEDKYWSGKYVREIKGFSNLKKEIELITNRCFEGEFSKFDIEEPLTQKILIDVIKKLNIKCLLAKKTINKITTSFVKEYEKEYNSRIKEIETNFVIPPIDLNKNSVYIDPKIKNKKSLIKDMEKNE